MKLDRILAASQNDPDEWPHKNSRILGQAQPVFADDSNLTLNDAWFFALAEFSDPYQYLLLRAGEFDGFVEGRYVVHFDLAGRARKGYGGTNLTVIKAESCRRRTSASFAGKPKPTLAAAAELLCPISGCPGEREWNL